MKYHDKVCAEFCRGNATALEWVGMWHNYVHEIDDIVDEDDWRPERLLKCLIMANDLYSHTFYIQFKDRLQIPILCSTNTYRTSVQWERSPELWKRQWADVLRHCGGLVHETVAVIVGGYENLQSMSAPLLAGCYIAHKDKYGLPQ